MRRAQLEDKLVLSAKIDLLRVRAPGEIPEMQAVAISAAEQDFRNKAILECIGRAPFARHHRVVAEVPPAVITELLRPAVDLPSSEQPIQGAGVFVSIKKPCLG